MGCNQSSEGEEPVPNPTLARNTSGILNQSELRKSTVNPSPEDFAITMVGNTSAHSLVLGFSGEGFHPIPSRASIPRFSHALLKDR